MKRSSCLCLLLQVLDQHGLHVSEVLHGLLSCNLLLLAVSLLVVRLELLQGLSRDAHVARLRLVSLPQDPSLEGLPGILICLQKRLVA